MKNTAFQRALISLSHPVSIGALVILLLNDHWWRQVAPSWLTGKIGDFTWLIFAPFLLATILAWLIPPRLKHQEEIIGRGSIVVVGLVFAFAKAIPAFHSLTIQVLETLTGWGNVLRMDPTDLLALPALIIAWQIWDRSAGRSIRLPNRGWVLIPLAVLATMADSPAPNSGISCVNTQADSTLIANDAYLAFVSPDGGATWEQATQQSKGMCQGPAKPVIDSTNSNIQYRFLPDEAIERSADSGATWQREFTFSAPSEPEEAFHKKQENSYLYNQRPISAVFHEPTGNLVLAMGYDGVLVRTTGGRWQWVDVGYYAHTDFSRADTVITLLSGEMLLALPLAALMIATAAYFLPRSQLIDAGLVLVGLTGLLLTGLAGVMLSVSIYALVGLTLSVAAVVALRWRAPRSGFRLRWKFVILAMAWMGWLITLILFPPALESGYTRGIEIMSAIAVSVLAVPVAFVQARNIYRTRPRALLLLIVIAGISMVLFLLPYVIWSQGGIPFHSTATTYTLVLVIATLVVGNRYLRQLDTSLPTAVDSAK